MGRDEVTMSALVRYEVEVGGIARITLDSPDTRNALSDALLDETIAAFEKARDDSAVRVVVLSSSHDRIFSAGGDLKAFSDDRAAVEALHAHRCPRQAGHLCSQWRCTGGCVWSRTCLRSGAGQGIRAIWLSGNQCGRFPVHDLCTHLSLSAAASGQRDDNDG